MTLFDLVFIVVALTTLVSLVSSGVLVLRGRRGSALRRLGRLALGLVVYMGAVTLVSLIEPRRVVALGEDQCSDDWCVVVVSARSSPSSDGSGRTVEVGFNLKSRARGVSQRERFVVAYLLDSEGRRYDAGPLGGAVPFDVLLAPGEAVATTRTFDVAADAEDMGVVVAREGDFDFPWCCIIGQGPFFEYPIVPIASALDRSWK